MVYNKNLRIITSIEVAIYTLLILCVVFNNYGLLASLMIWILSFFLAVMFCIELSYPKCKEHWRLQFGAGNTGVRSQYLILCIVALFFIPILNIDLIMPSILLLLALGFYILLFYSFLIYFLYRKELGYKEYTINYRLKFKRVIFHSVLCALLLILSGVMTYLKL